MGDGVKLYALCEMDLLGEDDGRKYELGAMSRAMRVWGRRWQGSVESEEPETGASR